VHDARNGATRDVSTDFQGAGGAGGDVIDVNGLDTNPGAGNQNFAFISTSACTMVNQLRYGLDLPTNLTMLQATCLTSVALHSRALSRACIISVRAISARS